MTETQADTILARLDVMQRDLTTVRRDLATLRQDVDHLDRRAVTKGDVFQAVMTVQAFTAALIVGVIVVINLTVGIA